MRDWIVSKYHLQQDLEKWDIFLFKISLFITYSYSKSLWLDWFIFLADPREDGTYSRRTSASWPHCSSTPKILNSPRGSQEVCRYPAHPACIAQSLLSGILATSNVQMLFCAATGNCKSWGKFSPPVWDSSCPCPGVGGFHKKTPRWVSSFGEH